MTDMKNMSPEELMELQKQNCIFCKIISGEIPSTQLYQDDKVLIILDINPASEGHALILPKVHYQILPQIPEDMISHMSVMAKRTSRTLLKGLGVKGTSVFIANGAMAGQKAPHFMIHVIPRKKGDMILDIPKNKIGPDKLDEVHKKIGSRLSALTGKSLHPAQKEHNEQPAKPENTDNKRPAEKDEKKVKNSEDKSSDDDIDLDKISEIFK